MKITKEFQAKLIEWIGDVFYDILPEHDYEIRDEQIYTAFQIADAMCANGVHFAEAGLGTGKTFAYLLSAIGYARYSKKPVVIACATPALQTQLASPGGDIATLSSILGLEVDVQMAKDPNQYLCDIRANAYSGGFGEKTEEVEAWIASTQYGERQEMPALTDEEWQHIKWTENMNCDLCNIRGYCRYVKAREAYRQCKDLLIVDHETYFHDLWTREERIEDRRTPILPEYSAVIFDEGHKILLPARLQAGHAVKRKDMMQMIEEIHDLQGARESFSLVACNVEDACHVFFDALEDAVVNDKGQERLSVLRSKAVQIAAIELKETLDLMLVELQIEQELYTESLAFYQIQAFESQIEEATLALFKFLRQEGQDVIWWLDQARDRFWVVPRHIQKMLEKHLFSKKLPVILTSATLGQQGDFSLMKRLLGTPKATASQIDSPFDLENQLSITCDDSDDATLALRTALVENGGRALVLLNSMTSLQTLREHLDEKHLPFNILWEDQGERGHLLECFKEDETSVLVGVNYWEGIDVPGEALTLVAIMEFPYDHGDPLIDVQCEEAKQEGVDPMETIVYPEMALKLKQGCGRLIRTETDHGRILILDRFYGMPWEPFVRQALPISL